MASDESSAWMASAGGAEKRAGEANPEKTLSDIYEKLFNDPERKQDLSTLLDLIKIEYMIKGGERSIFEGRYVPPSPLALIDYLIYNLEVKGFFVDKKEFIQNCLNNYYDYLEANAKSSEIFVRGTTVEVDNEETGETEVYTVIEDKQIGTETYYSLYNNKKRLPKVPAHRVRLHTPPPPQPIIETPSSSQVWESQGGGSQGRYNRLPGGGARRSLRKARRNRRTTMRNRRTTMRNRRSVRPLRKR